MNQILDFVNKIAIGNLEGLTPTQAKRAQPNEAVTNKLFTTLKNIFKREI